MSGVYADEIAKLKTMKLTDKDDEIWEKAKIQAEKENRKLSNFIATILKMYLEEKEIKKR